MQLSLKTAEPCARSQSNKGGESLIHLESDREGEGKSSYTTSGREAPLSASRATYAQTRTVNFNRYGHQELRANLSYIVVGGLNETHAMSVNRLV